MKRSQLIAFGHSASDQARAQLTKLQRRGLYKKAQVEDIALGFRDGWSSCVRALVDLGALTVEEDVPGLRAREDEEDEDAPDTDRSG